MPLIAPVSVCLCTVFGHDRRSIYSKVTRWSQFYIDHGQMDFHLPPCLHQQGLTFLLQFWQKTTRVFTLA